MHNFNDYIIDANHCFQFWRSIYEHKCMVPTVVYDSIKRHSDF